MLCFVPALEIELTRLLDKQGTNLFDIFNPEVLPQDVSVLLAVFHVVKCPFLSCTSLYLVVNLLLHFPFNVCAAGLCGDENGFWFPSSPLDGFP